MKITNEHIFNELNPASNGQAKTSGQSGFAEMLADMVAEKTAGAQQGAAASASQTVQAQNQEMPDMWFQVNSLLDTLDAYGQALGDPNHTLKQMEPLVNSMEKQAEQLEAQLVQGDEGSLSGLAAQAVMSAKVESVKYWRGDYIS